MKKKKKDKFSLADFFIDFLVYVVDDPRNKGRDIDLQILKIINSLRKFSKEEKVMAKLESQVTKTYTLTLDEEEMEWLERIVAYPILIGYPQEPESPHQQLIRQRLKDLIINDH